MRSPSACNSEIELAPETESPTDVGLLSPSDISNGRQMPFARTYLIHMSMHLLKTNPFSPRTLFSRRERKNFECHQKFQKNDHFQTTYHKHQIVLLICMGSSGTPARLQSPKHCSTSEKREKSANAKCQPLLFRVKFLREFNRVRRLA